MAKQENLGSVPFVRGKVLEKIAWRKRGIADLLDSLQAKDILVVSELSRLGRSMLECREILSIAAQKDVNVYAVNGAWRLDQSIQSYVWDFSSLCWDLPIVGDLCGHWAGERCSAYSSSASLASRQLAASGAQIRPPVRWVGR